MEEYTLEDLANHLHFEGIKGVQPVIMDYDWEDEDARCEGAVRVTVWLKRKENND